MVFGFGRECPREYHQVDVSLAPVSIMRDSKHFTPLTHHGIVKRSNGKWVKYDLLKL